MGTSRVVVSQLHSADVGDAVHMSAALCATLLDRAQEFHRAGLKSFGLLLGDPAAARHPFEATDFVLLDPSRNRRNDPHNRAAFHAQGDYFRQYDDAGFVADPTELLAVYRQIEDSGREIVAPFHIHRRQPANFSVIDYRLHNPAFAWHLIISLRDPWQPALQPFRVRKHEFEMDISESDGRRGSEQAYVGPEVAPLSLVAHGSDAEIRRLRGALHTADPSRMESAAG